MGKQVYSAKVIRIFHIDFHVNTVEYNTEQFDVEICMAQYLEKVKSLFN